MRVLYTRKVKNKNRKSLVRIHRRIRKNDLVIVTSGEYKNRVSNLKKRIGDFGILTELYRFIRKGTYDRKVYYKIHLSNLSHYCETLENGSKVKVTYSDDKKNILYKKNNEIVKYSYTSK